MILHQLDKFKWTTTHPKCFILCQLFTGTPRNCAELQIDAQNETLRIRLYNYPETDFMRELLKMVVDIIRKRKGVNIVSVVFKIQAYW